MEVVGAVGTEGRGSGWVVVKAGLLHLMSSLKTILALASAMGCLV